MKIYLGRRVIVAAPLLLLTLPFVGSAQGPPKERPEPTPEQKALYREMHAKTEAIKKECMEKIQAVRQEYEPKFKALGMNMPGEGRGHAEGRGPKPGMR